MIKYISGDIFSSKCEVLTNPVNCVGVMGGGLAKQFKDKFPEMNEAYVTACEQKMLDIGKLLMWDTKSTSPEAICLFPTKRHWKMPSRAEYVESGLQTLVDVVEEMKYGSIALPQLGCGLGGLSFKYDVKPLIEYYFESVKNVTVEIYLPEE